MRKSIKPIVVSLVFVFCVIMLSGVYAQEDVFPSDYDMEDAAVGDFVEIKIEMDEYGNEMSGYQRQEVTDLDSEITVKGTEYTVLTLSIYGEGTLSYSFGGEGNWIGSGEVYYDISTEDVVKETSTLDITYTYQGETRTFIQEITKIPLERTSTLPEGTVPSIGDNWTQTETVEETNKETTIYEDGEKETTTETTTETTVYEYEYLRNEEITIPAGTFTCRVIKCVSSDDDPGEYKFKYREMELDQPVKEEKYDSDGTQLEEFELIAYKFKNIDKSGGESVLGSIGNGDEAGDKGLFNMGKIGGIDVFIVLLILAAVIIVIIVGIVYMKKGGRTTEPQEVRYSQQPYTQPQQVQQAPVSYPCPSCGQPLTYVAQYQRWYCNYCSRYL